MFRKVLRHFNSLGTRRRIAGRRNTLPAQLSKELLDRFLADVSYYAKERAVSDAVALACHIEHWASHHLVREAREIVKRHGGCADFEAPFAVRGTWGLPLADENALEHALDAAFELQGLLTWRAHDRELEMPTISIHRGEEFGLLEEFPPDVGYRYQYLGEARRLTLSIADALSSIKSIVVTDPVTTASEKHAFFPLFAVKHEKLNFAPAGHLAVSSSVSDEVRRNWADGHCALRFKSPEKAIEYFLKAGKLDGRFSRPACFIGGAIASAVNSPEVHWDGNLVIEAGYCIGVPSGSKLA